MIIGVRVIPRVRSQFSTIIPIALGAWLLVAAEVAAEPPPVASGAEAATAALEALNRESRGAYAWARNQVLASQGPIILADLDTLTLLNGPGRETVTIAPPARLPLKASAHVPLALFGLFAALGERPLATAQIEALRRMSAAGDRAIEALAQTDFSAEQRTRVRTILEASLARAQAVIARGTFALEEMKTLADEIRPALLASIRDAARLQIDAYQAVVTRWRSQLGADQWGRLRVIVMGSQMPRKDNLTVQYFARLLGEPGESKRIIYAESLYEEPRALSLLGTHLIDSAAAQGLFGDPLRLDRDLLGDAAREYLATKR
jgi:hypothetical protein